MSLQICWNWTLSQVLNIEYRIFYRILAIEFSKYIDVKQRVDKKAPSPWRSFFIYSLFDVDIFRIFYSEILASIPREILASIPFHYLKIYLPEEEYCNEYFHVTKIIWARNVATMRHTKAKPWSHILGPRSEFLALRLRSLISGRRFCFVCLESEVLGLRSLGP